MIRTLLISFLFSLTFQPCTASENAPVLPDSSGFLYEHNLKYIGSNFRIDMNYRYILEDLAEKAIADTLLYIHVRGHVCCGPSYRLSKRRAKQVYKFLKRMGVPKERLSYKGYSDTAPVVYPEKTEEDEANNRRVDFILYHLN